MADLPSPTELSQGGNDDMLELNKDLERMIEDVENISVQLTWMSYDMVVLQTSPEQGDSMRRLEEAYLSCRAAVCGESDHEIDQSPETDGCSDHVDPTASSQTDI